VARKQRSAHVDIPLVEMPSEVGQRLRCIAETVE
jgi:hypothetical protein